MIRHATHTRPLVALLALALLTGLVPTAPSVSAQGTTEAIKPFFYGTVRIADRWADDGVEVDVLVVRAIDDYTICGHGVVGDTGRSDLGADMRGPGAYLVPVETIPECLGSNIRYSLYVNQVHALTAGNPGFSPRGGSARENLHVREVAINNRWMITDAEMEDTSIPLLYFYGTVSGVRGMVPDGTEVRVESTDGLCSARTRTYTLNWTPRADPHNPLVIAGFYQVGMQPGKDCADRPVRWNYFVDGRLVHSSQTMGRPYGTEVHEALSVQAS